jgi:hypothetical protein
MYIGVMSLCFLKKENVNFFVYKIYPINMTEVKNPLCKYKDIIGKPGEGAHSIRFLGVSIVDVLVTLLAALLISWIFKIHVFYTIIPLFFSGIILHRMFCVNTAIDRLLFG